MKPPTSIGRNTGRLVGLGYLLVSIPGFFALVYVPNKLIVHGDAAATANNIEAAATLFRFGIAANVVMEILFMGVVLALYYLFKNVSRRQAALMLGLLVVSVPISLVNELNSIAALLLIQPDAVPTHGVLSVFTTPQRDALAMLFLNLHSQGFAIAGIFWGLWLFPLGLLVYRSRFMPRILGVLLILNCVSYVVDSLTSLLAPQHVQIVSQWTKPLSFGELIFMFWILIMGADPTSSAGPPPTSAL
jgi:hypothetical protein